MTTYAAPGFSARTEPGQPFTDPALLTALILLPDSAATLGYAVNPGPGPGVPVLLSSDLVALISGDAVPVNLGATGSARLQEVIWDGGAARAQFLFFTYDYSYPDPMNGATLTETRSLWIPLGGDTPPAFADAAAMQAFFATATDPGPGSGLDGPTGLIPLAGLAATEDDLLDNRLIGATDSLEGGLGNDTLIGDGAAVLYGGEGDDLILAPVNGSDSANDSLFGGAGHDTLRAEDGEGSDSFYGGEGDDLIEAYQYANLLEGGDGNDTLIGASNRDYMQSSNDTLFGGAGQDSLVGGDGNDGLGTPGGYFESGSYDLLYGGADDDTLRGGSGYDTLYGDEGNDLLDGGDDGDRLYGGAGDDTLEGGDSYDMLEGGDGTDLLFGGTYGDRLFGGAGDDTLHGDMGAPELYGGFPPAADLLDGGIGSNLLYGGVGNDTLTGGDLSGGIDSHDTLYGGAGNDSLTGGDGLSIALTAGGLYISGSFDLLWGGDGQDSLFGGGGYDTLQGDEGNDHLHGGDDEDLLFGGEGQDSLYGGAGWDHLGGGALADRLEGDDGNDRLDGGTGDDTLLGGLGNDTYVVEGAGDLITGEIGFSLGGGIDTVEVWIDSFVAPTNVEILRLQGTGDLTATGNDAPGTLVGNAGHNTLFGRGGNDQINGNAGADTLVGGVGADTLVGGDGADHFVFTAVADSRATPAERDFINGFTHGQDRINLSAIDANPFLAGDQAFRFIGNAAFSGDGAASAGQMRFQAYGGNWNIVSIDRDGNGVAEMQIFVNLTNFMTGSDFIL